MITKEWGVIFDVDGTMVDNKDFHQQAWIELCRRYGMNLTSHDYRTRIHARPNDKIIPDIFGSDISKERTNSIAMEKETIYRNLYRPHIKPINGLIKLLNELKANCIPCAAASNSPSGNVDLVLNELHIREYFDSVICADDVKNGKPDPELFIIASAHMNLKAEQCLIIEDSAPGFEAAQRAGALFVAITAGVDGDDLTCAADAIGTYRDYTTISFAVLRDYMRMR